MELNHSFAVMKKIKLIGEPFKIYKNTAFIKNMFNSEVNFIVFKLYYIWIIYVLFIFLFFVK